MAALSIVVRAFGFQFSHQLIGALMKRAHPRIFPGALKRVLVDHDDRLVEHIVQLVLVECCGHRLSVAQRGPQVDRRRGTWNETPFAAWTVGSNSYSLKLNGLT